MTQRTRYSQTEFAGIGGPMTYSPNFPDMFRRLASHVDKILRGAKPSDLPSEQPTKFELVIDLKTANALGLTILPSLLLRADHIIVMNRRTFFRTGVIILVTPLAAKAQPAAKIYRVGILAVNHWTGLDAVRVGLGELGYAEGRNVRYEYRWADGRDERLPELARDLARQNVSVIVTWGTPAARAAKEATTRIPIVSVLGDPVVSGVATDVARPGGNITGFMTLASPLEAKRLEIIKQLAPNIVHVAVLWNPMNLALRHSLDIAQSAATALALKLELAGAHEAAGLEHTLGAIAKKRPDALLIMADPFLMTERRRIAEFAASNRLPAVANYREYATEAGGLISYGPDYVDLFRRAAVYIDKIFKGIPPGDLPFQQPSKFELIINVKTARAIGLTIPPALLLRADRVME